MNLSALAGIDRFRVAILTGAVLPLLIVACGSDSGEAATPGVDAPVIIRNGDVFDVDSFVNAGWKKSKEFSIETVCPRNYSNLTSSIDTFEGHNMSFQKLPFYGGF